MNLGEFIERARDFGVTFRLSSDTPGGVVMNVGPPPPGLHPATDEEKAAVLAVAKRNKPAIIELLSAKEVRRDA